MAAVSRKAARKAGSRKTASAKSRPVKAGPKAKPKPKTAKAKPVKAKATKAKAAKTMTGKTPVKVPGKAVLKSAAKAKSAKTKSAKTKAAKAKAVQSKAAKSKAGKSGANRRRFDRRDTRIPARLEHAGGSVEGTVANLSLEGCLFAPRIALKPNSRIKLYMSGESKPVAATVKAVSDLGVHCLLHAGGVTLGRLSADLDDMALLMLNAGRPHVVTPKAE